MLEYLLIYYYLDKIKIFKKSHISLTIERLYIQKSFIKNNLIV